MKTAPRRCTATKLGTRLLVAGLWCVAATARAGATGPLPEEQLNALEQATFSAGVALPWNRLVTRFPYYAYFQLFHEQYTAAKAAARTAATLAANPPEDPATPLAAPANVPGPDPTGFSKAAAATSGLAMGLSPIKGAMVAGISANTASNALIGASIALDILSFIGRDTNDADNRYKTLAELKSPSLYLLKSSETMKTSADFYAEIVSGQQMLAAFALQCEPARWHDERPAAVGYRIGGVAYNRTYFCGYGPEESPGFFGFLKEIKRYSVIAPSNAPAIAIARLEALDKMKHMPRLLGLPEDQMKEAARVLYEKIKDKVPPEWTAVFTATGKDGGWHVYAASNNYVVEFPSPPTK